jgi:hypothetical protein
MARVIRRAIASRLTHAFVSETPAALYEFGATVLEHVFVAESYSGCGRRPPLSNPPPAVKKNWNICEVSSVVFSVQAQEAPMGFGKGALLWLLGIPLPIIILLAIFWHH